MQHSLVGKISKQSIIMKNMGHYYKPNHYTLPDAKNVRFWVNPLYALFRLLKGDFRGLHFYFKRNATSPISLTEALAYGPVHFFNTRES